MQPRKFKIKKYGDGTCELVMKSRWHGIYWSDLYIHEETGNIKSFLEDHESKYDYENCKGNMMKIKGILTKYSDYMKSRTVDEVIPVRYVIDEPVIISTIETTQPVSTTIKNNNRELDIIESFVQSRSDAYLEKRRKEREPVYYGSMRDLGPK